MFNTILTYDPSNWPWTAYINLPLLSIRLITSQFQTSPLIIPLMLWHPASAGPVGEQGRRVIEYWYKPENRDRLSQMKFNTAHSWPPPPLILSIIGFPVIRVFYHKFYAYLYLKCMGTPLPPPRRFIIRFILNEEIMINIELGPDQIVQRLQQWREERQQQQQQVPAAAAAEDPDLNAAAEGAGQIINAASFGLRIGGALIIPSISSFMGNLLFRLSKHSGILQSFLGIRPTNISWTDYMLPPLRGLHSRLGVLSVNNEWDDLKFYQKVPRGFQVLINTFASGSWTLTESDPVWCVFFFFLFFLWGVVFGLIKELYRWRNAVGLGIFIVVCCFSLL